MQNATDRKYLREDQYRTTSNLDARIALHGRFSTNKYDWNRWVFDQLTLAAGSVELAHPATERSVELAHPATDGARVLEIGCGPGTLWTTNADRVPEGVGIVLTDLSEGMARQARTNLAGRGFVDMACVADAQGLPFGTGSFDIVVANHMLYHVPNRPRAIAEIARVLRPGGYFFAATNGNGHMDELYVIAKEFDSDAVDRGAPAHAGFSLENGAEQLAPYFASVDCLRFEDGLRITEAEPLIAYLLSGFVKPGASTAGWREALDARIARDSAIDIAKSTGIFIARVQDLSR